MLTEVMHGNKYLNCNTKE